MLLLQEKPRLSKEINRKISKFGVINDIGVRQHEEIFVIIQIPPTLELNSSLAFQSSLDERVKEDML